MLPILFLGLDAVSRYRGINKSTAKDLAKIFKETDRWYKSYLKMLMKDMLSIRSMEYLKGIFKDQVKAPCM